MGENLQQKRAGIPVLFLWMHVCGGLRQYLIEGKGNGCAAATVAHINLRFACPVKVTSPAFQQAIARTQRLQTRDVGRGERGMMGFHGHHACGKGLFDKSG